ncbi:MAG: hypothetical protein ABIN89_10655 [Chitinophagaceae bacterium]
MGKISNEAELKASIRELELKTIQQEKALKDNLKSTIHSFRPTNLVKIGLKNVKQVAVTRDIRSTAVNTFIGLAAGYLTRRFFIGKTSNNIFKRTAGAAIQAAITKMVFRKLPLIQEKTAKLISDISHQTRKNHR